MTRNSIRPSLVLAIASLAFGCTDLDGADRDADRGLDDSPIAASSVWRDFTTDGKTLTLTSWEPLRVNSPFFGITVRKNGVDITYSIESITSLSPTSWRYTFGYEILDNPGDVIEISLDNRKLATPGHYIALRAAGFGDTVQEMYQLLQECEAGTGVCAGDPPRPGLVASVKGISRRYLPRDVDLEIEEGLYDFAPIFEDAAYLASVGKRLHVIFTIKTFGIDSKHDGDGVTTSFPVPAAWDKGREREVHVYVDDVEVPHTLDATRSHVVLATAPPPGTKNVNVVYARDPFPEYTWSLPEPIGGWYAGGPDTAEAGAHGFVHAPWRSSCVDHMRNLMAGFREEWTWQIKENPALAWAIESVSIQETSNSLGGSGYTEQAYRDGLVEYAKFTARAVRGRAVFGQMFSDIPGGNETGAVQQLATAIIPWGARLEGPVLFNEDSGLDGQAYQEVHRELHDRALTMIWHGNASYREPDGNGGFYTPAQQYEKARRGITDTQTASGAAGLQAEYVFWNMTPSNGIGYSWKDALTVIAANPIIQTTGGNRHRWRRADYKTIPNQSLERVNP